MHSQANRRIPAASPLFSALCLLSCAVCAVTLSPGETDLTQYVNLMWLQGTVAAATPFGMTQPGPWTENPSIAGFRAGENIRGFSVNRLSGVGCHVLNNFAAMPVTVALTASPSSDLSRYTTAYSSIDGSPGALTVDLADGTRCEMAATARGGLIRFTFAQGVAGGTVLIHAGIHNNRNGEECDAASVAIGTDDVVRCVATGNRFCDGRNSPMTLYYAARFDRPLTAFGTFTTAGVAVLSRQAANGRCGAYVTFDTQSEHEITMKFALSYVSAAKALANLDGELPGWDLSAVADSAATSWNHLLNQIRVTASGADSLQQKRVFYTNLYRSLLHPSLSSDIDGEYMGFDNLVHGSSEHHMYTMFSGWDVYRSQTQLASLMAPEIMADICQSFVEQSRERNGGYPRWTVGNVESGIMSGNPAVPTIASAYAFGVRGFEHDSALHRATLNGNQDRLIDWRRYITSPDLTLEYCIVDFSISRLASMLGDTPMADRYLVRSDYWRSLYNPATRLLCDRLDSPWAGFGSQTSGWLEGTAEVYFWMVPHNARSLMDTLGGSMAASARLDTFFSTIATGYDYGSIYYNAGNEPDIHAPWLYNWAGQPYKTQEVVRRIIDQCFAGGGVPGDDDLGTMSAWYVFAALGLFPSVPGVAGFSVNTPLFEEAVVHWPATGNTTTVRGGSSSNDYIQSLTVDGNPRTRPWLWFDSIADGGVLQYTTSVSANTAWGGATADQPPSWNTVSQDWSPNLAYQATATASGACAAGEGAEYATDGLGNTKWCAHGSGSWLAADLGAPQAINKWVVLHAEMRGENPLWNTRDFRLQSSTDGITWVDRDAVTGNTAAMTAKACTEFAARYVRLHIDDAGEDNTARICEFEVHYATADEVVVSAGPAGVKQVAAAPQVLRRAQQLWLQAYAATQVAVRVYDLNGRVLARWAGRVQPGLTPLPVMRGAAGTCLVELSVDQYRHATRLVKSAGHESR